MQPSQRNPLRRKVAGTGTSPIVGTAAPAVSGRRARLFSVWLSLVLCGAGVAVGPLPAVNATAAGPNQGSPQVHTMRPSGSAVARRGTGLPGVPAAKPGGPPATGSAAAGPLSPGNAGPLEQTVGFTGQNGLNGPPDPQVAVGPTYVVETANAGIAVYDRVGNLQSTRDLTTLFGGTSIPNSMSSPQFTDPKVFYDAPSGRFYAVALVRDACSTCSTFNNSDVRLAWSPSSDPTGIWANVSVETNTSGILFDSPKLGVNDDKIVVTYPYDKAGATNRYVSVQKSDILCSGCLIHFVYWTDTSHTQTLPVHSLSSTTTEYMASIGFGGTKMTVFAITGTPLGNNSNLSSWDPLTIANVSQPPPAPQAMSGANLSTGNSTLSSAVWRANTMWTGVGDGCVPSGDNTSRACLRLDQVSTASGTPQLVSDVEYGVNGQYFYYPGVVTTPNGDLYLGETTSSGSAGGWATSQELHLACGGAPASGSVAANMDSLNFNNASGLSAYTDSDHNRWGDYFGSAVDPNNTSAVWSVSEWGSQSSTSSDYATSIGQFTIGGPHIFSVSPTSGGTVGGTTVDIYGQGFEGCGQSSVTFGGTSATSVTFISPTHLQAVSPAHAAGTVDIQVNSSNGSSPTGSTDQFTYVAPPWSVSLSASAGSVPVNTTVTLTATASQNVGTTPYYIEVYDLSSNAQVGYCGSGTTCSLTVTKSSATTVSYVAYVASYSATNPPPGIQATSNQVSVTWRVPYTVSLQAGSATAPVNTSVTLTAQASSSVSSTGFYIEIYDLSNNTLVAACSTGATCSGSVTRGAAATVSYVAYVASYSSTSPPANVQATSGQVSVTWYAPFTVSLAASANNVPAGTTVTLTATASHDVSGSTFYIEIYDLSNNSLVAACSFGTTCSGNVSRSGAASVPYTAYVGTYSNTYPPPNGVVASSNQVNVTWWTVTLSASTANVGAGNQVTLTARASRDIGGSGYDILVYDLTDNFLAGACSFGSTCSVNIARGPAGTVHFLAYVAPYATINPPPNIVAMSNQVDVIWWSVSLTANPNPQLILDNITLTANASGDVGGTGLYIQIYDGASGQRVGYCGFGSSCSLSVSDPDTLEGLVPLPTCRTYIADVAGYGTAYAPPGIVAEAATTARWTVVNYLQQVVDLGCSPPLARTTNLGPTSL